MAIWKDVSQKFTRNPLTDDVSIASDRAAIRQSIHNLVLSEPTDHKFHPEIYCIAKNMLFENINSTDKQMIARDIRTVLETYEKRIVVRDIDVEADPTQRTLTIKVYYYFAKLDETDVVNIVVKQLR